MRTMRDRPTQSETIEAQDRVQRIARVIEGDAGTAKQALLSAYLHIIFDPKLGYVDFSNVDAAAIGMHRSTFTQASNTLHQQGDWLVERRKGKPNRYHPIFFDETSSV